MPWKTRVKVGKFEVCTGAAGLVTLTYDRTVNCLHLLVRPSQWVWGYQKDWYDGPWYCFGFGPLFLLVICPRG